MCLWLLRRGCKARRYCRTNHAAKPGLRYLYLCLTVISVFFSWHDFEPAPSTSLMLRQAFPRVDREWGIRHLPSSIGLDVAWRYFRNPGLRCQAGGKQRDGDVRGLAASTPAKRGRLCHRASYQMHERSLRNRVPFRRRAAPTVPSKGTAFRAVCGTGFDRPQSFCLGHLWQLPALCPGRMTVGRGEVVVV